MGSYLNYEQKKIAEWINNLKFKRKIVGGLDEMDVWEKIEELNRMYEIALSAERARYDALLMRQRKAASQKPGTPNNVRKKEGELDG